MALLGTGIELSAGIVLGTTAPVDKRYGPYADLATAKTEVTSVYRYKGLTLGILVSGVVVEYWFKNGVADTDLIEKTSTYANATTSVAGLMSSADKTKVDSLPTATGGIGSYYWYDAPPAGYTSNAVIQSSGTNGVVHRFADGTVAVASAGSNYTIGLAMIPGGTRIYITSLVPNIVSPCFVVSAASSSGNVNSGLTGWFNYPAGAGYSATADNRLRVMSQDCVVRKVSLGLQQSSASVAMTGGSIQLYVKAPSAAAGAGTSYTLSGSTVLPTTSVSSGDFDNYSFTLATPITIPAGYLYAFGITWAPPIATNVRTMVDLYCYPS